jgi:predicted PurR-regulated permease PerM
MSDEPVSDETTLVDEPTWVRVWMPRIAFVALITVAIGAIFTWAFIQVSSFLLTIVMSLFLAFALAPAVDRLAQRGWRRGVATGLVMLIAVLIGLVFVFAFISLVVEQGALIANKVPGWVDALIKFLSEDLGVEISRADVLAQEEAIKDWLLSYSDDAIVLVAGVGASILGALFGALTMGLFVFYMTAEAPSLRRAVVRPFPKHQKERLIAIWDEASNQTGNYIYSRSLLAGFSAIFHTIAFLILGLPSALALGLFVGVVSQFVPNIGTYIAGALPVIVALASGDVTQAIWVIVIITVYQQFENIVLANKITAQTMDLHPAIAFGSVIIGANLLGAAGALLALPVAATIVALITASLAHRDDQDLPDDSVESGFIAPE